ncbi:MAG: 3-hydroxybutyryl-CoA dehydrogenase [Planctomycetaceae bacterium]|nr:3-hydroxybutyryl-CoA dehydrogenase [Planctomycetaceae bacterium]
MIVERLAVIGAGTMGRGIIEVAATHGVMVRAYDINDDVCAKAAATLRTSIERGIKRGKVSGGSADPYMQRVTFSCDLAETVCDAQFVIEAIPEIQELKLKTIGELDRLAPAGVVLASNTSSLSITKLAAATGRPERVVGMHFFNPVPVMAPVEIVRAEQTSEITMTETLEFGRQLGKEAFAVADVPGFAVNRILMPLINEAVFALQEGVADARTIDSLMKLGCNHPMGPLELADFVGLDVCLWILQVLHRELGDPKFRPCPLLARKVDAKHLGRKTGRGFYEYPRKE